MALDQYWKNAPGEVVYSRRNTTRQWHRNLNPDKCRSKTVLITPPRSNSYPHQRTQNISKTENDLAIATHRHVQENAPSVLLFIHAKFRGKFNSSSTNCCDWSSSLSPNYSCRIRSWRDLTHWALSSIGFEQVDYLPCPPYDEVKRFRCPT